MNRLLAIELQKIWKNKASRVLTLSYFIILSFIALIASIKFDLGIFKFHLAEMGIFNFPFIWHFNTYIAAILKLFLAIVIVSMMANEYSYGTLKQNLIDGMSKKEFLLSKFLTVVLFATASTIFVFVMSLILGLSFSSYTEVSIIFSNLEYLVAYFVKLVGFFSFCLFLGVLVKRSAFALGFLMVWNIIEGIAKGILTFKIFPNSSISDSICQFFPLESMSNLIVEPFTRLSVIQSIGTQMGVEHFKDYGVHWYSILIVIAWTVIFMLMSLKLLEKEIYSIFADTMTFFKNIYNIFIFSCFSTNSFAQYVTVTDTYTAKELIENVLINSPCASVSNFSVSGGFFGGQESFGYFSDSSRNFPFTDGIILSTGKAVSATGPNTSILSEGDTSWSGDTDLQEALGVNNTINATVLEFDFVPLTNKISFDYIFASEQYLSNPSSNQCNFTDGFAFLLKDLTNSDGYQNLALIPNTTIPVRINTVRGSGTVCPAANEAFFGGFNGSEHPTNFNGQTAVMKAQATVIPGNSYHIKLVVADQGNNLYDSAIFLGGGSFKFEKDLGPNRLLATNNPICGGQNYTLDATESGTNSYKWFKDDVDTGITTPTFLVTEAGKYKSEITIGTTTCKATGEVTIEYADLPILTNTTSVQCDEDKDGFGLFNLTKLDNIIKNNSNIGSVLYYQELSDAENQNTTKAITAPERYLSKPKTIYASVSNAYGCNAVASVILKISNNTVSSFHDLESCDLDDKIDGFYTFDLSKADPKVLSGLPSGLIVEYYETLNDALLQNNILSNNYRNTTRFEMTVYAKILNGSDCYGIIPLRLFVNSNTPKNFGDETLQLCEGGSKKLQVSTNFTNYNWSNGDKNYYTEIKEPGNYSVTVADSNTCLATKKFTVIPSGKAIITNVEINDFKESQNSVLIYYVGTGEYEFSIDGTFFQDSPLFNDVPVGEYTIRVRDKNGCGETTKKIYVLNYPKFFTPNGDSYNDVWTIKNIDLYPKYLISIFDRYGKLIYQFKGIKKGWDGKLNSRDLPSTDYWFVIDLGDDKIIKGHFTLMR